MAIRDFFRNLFGGGGNMNNSSPVSSIQTYFTNSSNVTEKDLLKIPTAQASLELICGQVGRLPIRLYKYDSDGMPTEVTNDYRTNLLNNETNNVLDGYSFKRKVVKDYLLYGASKSKIEHLTPTSNHIKAIYPLSAKYMTTMVYTKNGYNRFGVDRIDNSTGSHEYNDDELLSVVRDTDNGITGKGILDTNSSIFNLALQQLQYENSLLHNGATPSGVIQMNDRLTADTMNQISRGWANRHAGSRNAGRPAILSNGTTYKNISTSPDKLQLVNAKKMVVSDIARVFNVPESLVNAGANKYKSNEQDSIYFLQNCLNPILTAIESALDRTLLSINEQNGYHFKFDTSTVVNSTVETQANVASTLYNNSIITLKEARKYVGYHNLTSNDFMKLSQGNVMFDYVNDKLQILNKGQSIDRNDVSVDPDTNSPDNNNGGGNNNDSQKAEKENS